MPGTKDHRQGRPGSCGPPAARDQPGTTGVLCEGIFARTDRSSFRWARTSSYGVNASHCRSETSANLSVLHSSRKALEHHHGQGLCYAFTVRSITASGEATILTFLRNPYEKPANFREFLDILSTAAGSPPYYPDVDYAGATISDIPTPMSRREWLLEASKAWVPPPRPVASRSEP
jgi:hypothetical protein